MTLVAVGALVLAAAPAPAAAAAALELSRDGTRFTSSFPGSLFPEGRMLVPGDTADGRFWVRNGGDTPAWISLGLEQGAGGSRAYLRALTLSVDVDGARRSHPLDGAGCLDIAAPRSLAPGQRVEVTLSLGFDGVTGVEAQREVADLTFLVSMTDAAGLQTGMGACALAALPASASSTGPADPGTTPAVDPGPAGAAERVDADVELAGPAPPTEPNTAVDGAGYALMVVLAAALAGAALRMGSARRDTAAPEGET